MFYLGPCTGLAPKDELGRLRVNQVFLTLCDWQNEAVRHLCSLRSFPFSVVPDVLALLGWMSQHDVQCVPSLPFRRALTTAMLTSSPPTRSHPVAVGDYYEDQKPEAFRRSIDFRSNRLPKFLSFVPPPLPSSSLYPFPSELTDDTVAGLGTSTVSLSRETVI